MQQDARRLVHLGARIFFVFIFSFNGVRLAGTVGRYANGSTTAMLLVLIDEMSGIIRRLHRETGEMARGEEGDQKSARFRLCKTVCAVLCGYAALCWNTPRGKVAI